jgi:hypothetical protein
MLPSQQAEREGSQSMNGTAISAVSAVDDPTATDK